LTIFLFLYPKSVELKNIIDYIRSYRPEQVLVTLSVLFSGVWASSHVATARDYLVLTILAFSGHIFGYGINDLVDFPFDRNNPKHIYRVSLVSKGFKKGLYLAFTLLQLPLILLVGILAYGVGESIIYIGAALLSLTLYNLYSKRSARLVMGVHMLFPLALVLLCIGGFTLFDPFGNISWSFGAFLLALFGIALLANSFIGGIIDLNSDFQAGASTLVIVLNSRSNGSRVFVSRETRSAAMTIFWLIAFLIVLQGLMNSVPVWIYPIGGILIFYAYAHLVTYLKLDDPEKLIRYDAIACPSMMFYAATLAWIREIPVFWVSIIIFFLIYPFLVRREGRFGLPTLKAIFAK
jgi:4-hydroxybenzoate polyprenyltransferase